MAVPNPQQFKKGGSAPIKPMGQTKGSFGSDPNLQDRNETPTPVKP